jgi:hypothetical protein
MTTNAAGMDQSSWCTLLKILLPSLHAVRSCTVAAAWAHIEHGVGAIAPQQANKAPEAGPLLQARPQAAGHLPTPAHCNAAMLRRRWQWCGADVNPACRTSCRPLSAPLQTWLLHLHRQSSALMKARSRRAPGPAAATIGTHAGRRGYRRGLIQTVAGCLRSSAAAST